MWFVNMFFAKKPKFSAFYCSTVLFFYSSSKKMFSFFLNFLKKSGIQGIILNWL